MRTFCRCLIGLVAALASGVSAHAAISVAVTGPAAVTNQYEGDVDILNNGFDGPGTILDLSFTGSNEVTKTVTYSAADLDFVGAFGSGFRLTEQITNNSAHAWVGFTIRLTDITDTESGAGNFLFASAGAGGEVPGFAVVTPDPGDNEPNLLITSQVGVPALPDGRTLNLSNNQLEITIIFPQAITPGNGFTVNIPIEQIGNGGGVFAMSQQAIVPEPASLIVWSALGAAVCTAGWARRRRAVAQG